MFSGLRQRVLCATILSGVAVSAALAIPVGALAASTSVTSDVRTTLPACTRIGPTRATQAVSLAVLLPSRNPAGLASFISHVTQPGDTLFRHYLTSAQFVAQYGARASDYKAIVTWAKSHGLTVGEEYSAHNVLSITGAVKDLEAAFGVKFVDYKGTDGNIFYNASVSPKLPASIASKIMSILGLNNISRPVTLARKLPAGATPLANGSGALGAYSASDIRTAYGIPPAPATAPHETIAVFEAGGFDKNDIKTYLTANNLPSRPVVVRNVNGYHGGIDDPNVDLEAALDIDMVIGSNPDVKKVLVYEDGETDPFGVELVNSLAAIGSDNLAQTVSISYGEDEALQDPADIQAENTELQQLTAQGIAVFASAGDRGAYGDLGQGLNVSDPSAQPLVTAVGGTTLFTGAGAGYQDEITWNELGHGYATGGGVSTVWPIPTYQVLNGHSLAANNGGSSTNRNVPDVAAVADPYTGVAVYSALNGGWLEIGGTSVSAPIWAAFTSIASANSKMLGLGQIGFANPALYLLGPRIPGGNFGGYNDITDGSNGNAQIYGIPGFNAGYGYDNATGWGSPQGVPLSTSLALLPLNRNNTNPPPAPTGFHGTAASTSAKVAFTAAQGATGYLIEVLNPATRIFATEVITGTNHVVLNGLVPGTNYEFQLYSISPGGVTGPVLLYLSTSSAS
jgi:subtilase family serine protease